MKTKLVKALRGAWKAGLILTVVLCAAILCGCAGGVMDTAASTRETDNPPLEDLSEELEKRILQDCLDAYLIKADPDLTVNDIWVGEYYGTYNDCVVLNIQGLPYLTVVVEAVIADIKFYFEGSKIPMVWKDGRFYGYEPKYGVLYIDWASGGTLRAAYDSGLLTQDDLRSIAGYINSEEEEPVIIEGLSTETQKQILLDYFNSPIKTIWFVDSFKLEDYRIYGYFGTYNDYVMVGIGIDTKITRNRIYPAVMLPHGIIADWYYLTAFYSEPVLAWKNGQLYKVVDLYNNGNLTLDDLRNIASLNPAWKPISELRQEGK